MQEIVVDKSFIDGVNASVVHELCRTYDVLMTEELFFELTTTDDAKRRRAFCKLPDIANPVSLIPNVGTLLRFEKETGRPSAPLSKHKIEASFQFNSRLRDGTFMFEGTCADELASFRNEVEESTRSFIDRCFVVHEFFPEFDGIRASDLPAALVGARRTIATDENRVRAVYRLLIENHPQEHPPYPELIDGRWAWFRWVQVQLVAALRIFVRYQGRMPSDTSPRFWTVAEHTMLDSYYVLFGTLCGALASRDSEMRDDFQLLRPDGLLLPQQWITQVGSEFGRRPAAYQLTSFMTRQVT